MTEENAINNYELLILVTPSGPIRRLFKRWSLIILFGLIWDVSVVSVDFELLIEALLTAADSNEVILFEPGFTQWSILSLPADVPSH